MWLKDVPFPFVEAGLHKRAVLGQVYYIKKVFLGKYGNIVRRRKRYMEKNIRDWYKALSWNLIAMSIYCNNSVTCNRLGNTYELAAGIAVADSDSQDICIYLSRKGMEMVDRQNLNKS